MSKNYLLINFGNVNVKWSVYSEANDIIVAPSTFPNTKTAREIVNSFYSLRCYNIDCIVESVTTSLPIVRKFNEDLRQIYPNAKLKVIKTTDFISVFDKKYAHDLSSEDSINVDVLLSILWLKKNKPNACLVNFGAFYYAIVMKDGKLKSVYFMPGISRSITGLAYNHSTISFEEYPKTFEKTQAITTSQAISNGAATLMEGFIEKIMRDIGLADQDVILSGGDVDSYPQLTKRFVIDKDIIVKAITEWIKQTKNEWDKD